MKKILGLVFTAVFVLLCANTGFSHGPDSTHHAATKSQIEEKARKVVSGLVEKGKLDKSWNEVDAPIVEQKKTSAGTEWVARFFNKSETDSSKQTLYVFFRLNGEYLASNFTGK